MNKKNRVRFNRVIRWVNLQLEKVRRLSNIYTVVLLAINLSLSIFLLIEHRGVHPYVTVPIIFLLIGVVLWGVADLVIRRLGFFVYQGVANMTYTPFQVDLFLPFELMSFGSVHVPMLRAIADLQTDEKKKKDLLDAADRFQSWLDQGYIPRDAFPKKMRRHVIRNQEDKVW